MSSCLKMVALLGWIAGAVVMVGTDPSRVATVATQDGQTTAGAGQIPEQEKPFWENAQAFVDAYARHDAEAIGKLFTEDAEFYDEFGERTVGRQAIVQMFQDVFTESPEAQVKEIRLERIRFVTDDVALEEGVVVASGSADGPDTSSRYVALHKKEKDGVWRVHTLKDYAPEQDSRADHLNELAWLIGEWVSEDPSSIVKTECKWSDDGNYILRSFSLQIAGQRVMDGVQRIGWDPLRKQLRSWVFDSEGGFSEGTWRHIGSQWFVNSEGVTPEGEAASALAVYTIYDAERVAWQYRDLIVGNELREDIQPIVMVRRPPEPNTGE